MELTELEIKILKMLSKQKSPVNLDFVIKKCGECENALNNLFRASYIDCSTMDSLVQIGFPSLEDITISENGCEYLAKLKLDKKRQTRLLGRREFWEIVIGVFTGVAIVAIAYGLNI